MPELPEVTTVVRELIEHNLVGATIRKVRLRFPKIFGKNPETLVKAITGGRINAVGRRGKFIVIDLDNGARFLIHLRMTGKLRFGQEHDVGRHDHVLLDLDDGRILIYNDTRKFGRFTLCAPGADPLERLGPEPLEAEFTAAVFRERLRGRSRMIKPLLLDQSVVAGLGNIYVDEALWEARLHPTRRADTLTAAEIARLHRAIPEVLARGVANNGTTLGSSEANFYSVAGRRGRNADHLNVFRRDGQPCPRCGLTIEHSVVGQRGTHFCPACQKERRTRTTTGGEP